MSDARDWRARDAPPGRRWSKDPAALSARVARPPVRASAGVVLCRRDAATGRPQVLLAHKRYTYAFAEFVLGRYGGDPSGAGGAGSVASRRDATLDAMTREELLDVLSLNFAQMWYRVWLTSDNRDLYNKKCAKFQATFMRDGGAALRRAVWAARPGGAVLWEPPKGRHLSPRESDLQCAARELREEAGVAKSAYRFLPGARRRVSYVSGGTRYVCDYFVAVALPRLAAAPAAADPSRPTLRDTAEVGDVRWLDIDSVRLVDGPGGRLEALVAPALRLAKAYWRGRWASRRPGLWGPAGGATGGDACPRARGPAPGPESAPPAPGGARPRTPPGGGWAAAGPRRRSSEGARGRAPPGRAGRRDA